jgi:site-specific DNA-methyltransferase (adenine-specific)
MDEFRSQLLGDRRVRNLVDFPVSKEVFPGVEVKGGICYFLWNRDHSGDCEVQLRRDGEVRSGTRALDEFDVFVRDPRAIEILRKVLDQGEASLTTVLSRDTPFGLATNFDGFADTAGNEDVALYYTRQGRRAIGYVPRRSIRKNPHAIDQWKVLIPEAGSDGGQKIPDVVLGTPWIAPPGSVCTQSFLFVRAGSASEAASAVSYVGTKFFRFLVSLRKITQHALHSTYTWVPVQSWDHSWTDAELYAKYRLTDEEAAFVESQIKSLDVSNV